MGNCFGLLGSLLAFLGAIGFMMGFFGLIIGIGQVIINGDTRTVPAMLKVALIGAGLLIVVIILGFVNQFLLPSGCP